MFSRIYYWNIFQDLLPQFSSVHIICCVIFVLKSVQLVPHTHWGIFSKSYHIRPNSDCIYYFPIDLENGKYNLISVLFNDISRKKFFVCWCMSQTSVLSFSFNVLCLFPNCNVQTEKSFLNLVNPNQIWIVIAIFR